MRLFDLILDAASVFLTEFVEALALGLQIERVLAEHQPVELLFLVALTRLLDDDVHRQVTEQSFLELVNTISLDVTRQEVFE